MVRVNLNSVMHADQSPDLLVEEYKHTEDRKGNSDKYKPKTVGCKPGNNAFAIPQGRKGGFYSSVQKKGMTSEQTLLIAMAECVCMIHKQGANN